MFLDQRGLDFARVAITKVVCLGGQLKEQVQYAESRWGSASVAARVLKAAVPAGMTSDPAWAGALANPAQVSAEFFALVRDRSILGRIQARKLPLETPAIYQSEGVSASWVAQGQAIPVTSAEFAGMARLAPLKIVSMAVLTKELIKFSDPDAELAIRDDMVSALAEGLDATFIDPTNAGVTGLMPAAVTNGAPGVNATSDFGWNLRALIAAFNGNLERAYLIGNPETLVRFNSAERPDIGARGGEALGIPAIASRKVPTNIVAIVDGGGVAYASDVPEIDVSTEGSVQMNTAPDSPPTASTVMISLWQNNLAAIRSIQSANWSAQAGAVAVLTGIDSIGDSPV